MGSVSAFQEELCSSMGSVSAFRLILAQDSSHVSVRLDWQMENARISFVPSRRSRNMRRIESYTQSHALNLAIIARAMIMHSFKRGQ